MMGSRPLKLLLQPLGLWGWAVSVGLSYLPDTAAPSPSCDHTNAWGQTLEAEPPEFADGLLRGGGRGRVGHSRGFWSGHPQLQVESGQCVPSSLAGPGTAPPRTPPRLPACSLALNKDAQAPSLAPELISVFLPSPTQTQLAPSTHLSFPLVSLLSPNPLVEELDNTRPHQDAQVLELGCRDHPGEAAGWCRSWGSRLPFGGGRRELMGEQEVGPRAEGST